VRARAVVFWETAVRARAGPRGERPGRGWGPAGSCGRRFLGTYFLGA
jgi:hypothetical protein